jgi:5-methyltetrahydropteroyltriglutamate--homocysteine methyltransferase
LLRPGRAKHHAGALAVFAGVIDPINPKIETPQDVRDRVMEAAEIVPLESLGTTDDGGEGIGSELEDSAEP